VGFNWVVCLIDLCTYISYDVKKVNSVIVRLLSVMNVMVLCSVVMCEVLGNSLPALDTICRVVTSVKETCKNGSWCLDAI